MGSLSGGLVMFVVQATPHPIEITEKEDVDKGDVDQENVFSWTIQLCFATLS